VKQISRLSSDLVDAERTLRFSLPVLRQGPVIPLHGWNGIDHPVAVPADGHLP